MSDKKISQLSGLKGEWLFYLVSIDVHYESIRAALIG
jgi:hypothetical protein